MEITDSKLAILALLNLFLLAIGLFLHSAAAIILVVPVVMPLIQAAGIDPVHFGLIVTLEPRDRAADAAGRVGAGDGLLGGARGHLAGDAREPLVHRGAGGHPWGRDVCARVLDGFGGAGSTGERTETRMHPGVECKPVGREPRTRGGRRRRAGGRSGRTRGPQGVAGDHPPRGRHCDGDPRPSREAERAGPGRVGAVWARSSRVWRGTTA